MLGGGTWGRLLPPVVRNSFRRDLPGTRCPAVGNHCLMSAARAGNGFAGFRIRLYTTDSRARRCSARPRQPVGGMMRRMPGSISRPSEHVRAGLIVRIFRGSVDRALQAGRCRRRGMSPRRGGVVVAHAVRSHSLGGIRAWIYGGHTAAALVDGG